LGGWEREELPLIGEELPFVTDVTRDLLTGIIVSLMKESLLNRQMI
jgi:hypothetical protein